MYRSKTITSDWRRDCSCRPPAPPGIRFRATAVHKLQLIQVLPHSRATLSPKLRTLPTLPTSSLHPQGLSCPVCLDTSAIEVRTFNLPHMSGPSIAHCLPIADKQTVGEPCGHVFLRQATPALSTRKSRPPEVIEFYLFCCPHHRNRHCHPRQDY